MRHKSFAASQRLQNVQTPIIPEIASLIAQTPGTLSLGQGVVYYPPPTEALKRASEFENTFENHIYTDVTGIPKLREIISKKLESENAITSMEQRSLVVTAGSNMGFLNALLAITEPGDEVILLAPYYFNHEMAITMLGCNTIMVECDDNYQPRLDVIQAAITPRCKAIVTVSPNNPSGAVYPETTLRAINLLCKENGLFHISDEAYEYFTYDESQHFSPASIGGSEAHTLSLYSLSKAYGFAGWRIGYMLVPSQLELAIKKIQDTNLICATRISQEAAIAAITAGKAYCLQKRKAIESARNYLYEALQSLDDICSIPRTDGAFYFLLRLKTEQSGMTIVQKLIERHKVAVVPGETFGLKNGCYIRVAYGALDNNHLSLATDRLVGGLKNIIK